jgi:hypothetical protein
MRLMILNGEGRPTTEELAGADGGAGLRALREAVGGVVVVGAAWGPDAGVTLPTAGGGLGLGVLLTAAGAAVRGVGGAVPVWDAVLGVLSWLGECVRRFRHDAANQRALLDAFQARGWVRRLDDPLPRAAGVKAKTRLRETIKGLNRGQKPLRLRFRGDGTGGVCWEPVA